MPDPYDLLHREWTTFDPAFEHQCIGRDSVPYLLMHGSVHFGIGVGLQPFIHDPLALEPVWIQDLDQARCTWSEIRVDGESAFAFDSRMVTGRTKWQQQMVFPYGAYFSVFRRLAMTSSVWWIIGYSGHDPHIHRILLQAWRYRRHAGLPMTIIVVDCGDQKRLQDLLDNIFLYELDKPYLHPGRSVDGGWYQATPTQLDKSYHVCAWGQGIDALADLPLANFPFPQ